MSELLQSGQHPDADQLSAFIEHALPAHEREQTLAHLAICAHCRSVVAISLPPAEELPAPHPEPVRRPWLSGWNLVWPAAAALAALVFAGIYIRNGVVVPSHAPPTRTAQSFPPAPTLKLQSPRTGARDAARPTAAPGPEIATTPLAENLLHAPGSFGNARKLNQLRTPAASASTSQRRAASAQSSTGVSVAAAHQTIQRDSVAVGENIAADQAQTLLPSRTLPSGLRALSTVVNGRQALAIDTQNTLFFSNDGGAHWNIITQPWQGRALKVELVRSSYPAGTGFGAGFGAGIIGGAAAHDSIEGAKAGLSGEVTDPAGASIANASVVVTNSLTQVARRTKTDPGGRYSVDRLDPGNYTLDVEAPGFTPQQISGVALNPAQQSQKDLMLAVGSLSQTVEVQGQTQPVTVVPQVKEKVSATHGALLPPSLFEITTDTGEHWTSTDGRSWKRKDGSPVTGR